MSVELPEGAAEDLRAVRRAAFLGCFVVLLCIAAALGFANRGDERILEGLQLVIAAFVGACTLVWWRKCRRNPSQDEDLWAPIFLAGAAASVLFIFRIFIAPLPEARDRIYVRVVHYRPIQVVLDGPLMEYASPRAVGYRHLREIVGFAGNSIPNYPANPNDGKPRTPDEKVDLANADLMEAAFVRWLAMEGPRFVKLNTDTTMTEGGRRFRKGTYVKVRAAFPNNLLLKAGPDRDRWRVPTPASVQSAQVEAATRRIQISMSNSRLLVTMSHVSSGILDANVGNQGLTAYYARKLNTKEPLWENQFVVVFHWIPKRLTRWSPTTISERDWAEEVARNFENEFSRELLDQDILRIFGQNGVIR